MKNSRDPSSMPSSCRYIEPTRKSSYPFKWCLINSIIFRGIRSTIPSCKGEHLAVWNAGLHALCLIALAINPVQSHFFPFTKRLESITFNVTVIEQVALLRCSFLPIKMVPAWGTQQVLDELAAPMLRSNQLHVYRFIFDLQQRGEFVFVRDKGNWAKDSVQEIGLYLGKWRVDYFSIQWWQLSRSGRIEETAVVATQG